MYWIASWIGYTPFSIEIHRKREISEVRVKHYHYIYFYTSLCVRLLCVGFQCVSWYTMSENSKFNVVNDSSVIYVALAMNHIVAIALGLIAVLGISMDKLNAEKILKTVLFMERFDEEVEFLRANTNRLYFK